MPAGCAEWFRTAVTAAIGAESPELELATTDTGVRLECWLPDSCKRVDLSALSNAFDGVKETTLHHESGKLVFRIAGEMDSMPVEAIVRFGREGN